MRLKDPIWNFYNTLIKKKKKKKTSVRCLDCDAEVSAKVLRLRMSSHRRDETVHFSIALKYEYQNLAQYIKPSQKHKHLKIPNDHFNLY